MAPQGAPDHLDVAGRVAVVTGASRGLGAGMARRFAAAGLRLGLCARSQPALPDGDDVVARRVDVVDPAAVAAFADEVVERLGGIDLWVNNAGVLGPIAPLRDADAAEVATNVSVNVLGVVHGSQAFVRHVRRRDGGGVLVNVSSGAAHHGYAGWGAYCASKAAVERLTEVLLLEEGDAGVRPYALSPGVVDTDMQAAIRATPAEVFPSVERFLRLKEDEAFNSAEHVADHVLRLAFGDGAGSDDGWSVRVPPQR